MHREECGCLIQLHELYYLIENANHVNVKLLITMNQYVINLKLL